MLLMHLLPTNLPYEEFGICSGLFRRCRLWKRILHLDRRNHLDWFSISDEPMRFTVLDWKHINLKVLLHHLMLKAPACAFANLSDDYIAVPEQLNVEIDMLARLFLA